MPPIDTDRFAKVEVASTDALTNWLARNHGQTDSVWLVTYKKHCGDRYVSRDQVLDALIAFGWIDGIRRKLDENRTMQLISPRKQQAWAKTYKDRAARLISENRMHPAGLAAIERAKTSGLWAVAADVDALVVPEDLLAALESSPQAARSFATAPPSYRRNLLRWFNSARTEATRQKRKDQIVTACRNGERIPHF